MSVTRRHFAIAMLVMTSAWHGQARHAEGDSAANCGGSGQSGRAGHDGVRHARSDRVRLGIAGGLKKTPLTLPTNIVFGPTTLRFIADPIGANRNSVSDEITVSPGDVVTWTLRQ
jgi:hypothetical protein